MTEYQVWLFEPHLCTRGPFAISAESVVEAAKKYALLIHRQPDACQHESYPLWIVQEGDEQATQVEIDVTYGVTNLEVNPAGTTKCPT